MKDSDIQWCTSQLKSLTLQDDITPDLALLLGGMGERSEVSDFLEDLLGPEKVRGSQAQNFITSCLERFGARDNEVVYRKEKIDKLEETKSGKQQKNKSVFKDILCHEKSAEVPIKKKSPKKTQYIKIVSDNALSSVLLPGRNICHCLAQRHGLVNNCLACGRIVCEQEGEGPCMFCGVLVATPENTERISSQSRKGRELEYKLLNNRSKNFTPLAHYDIPKQADIQIEALKQAVEHKQRLLEYDRTNIHRSKVLDDESDYFQNTRWLSKEEKEVVHKKADERSEEVHKSRLKTKLTLDFAGRKIIDDESANSHSDMGVIYDDAPKQGDDSSQLRNNFEPTFVDRVQGYTEPSQYIQTPKSELNSKKSAIRNQDKDFKLLRDEGMCLTMHQPWASLLVAGIKKIEGRSWYSGHRGKLWIHAAAKQSSTAEISAIEDKYRALQGNDIEFPEHYPSSAVIGCVFVEDVLPYFENDEENGSEYLFICKDARSLPIPIKVKGQHKIWKLDKQTHVTVLDQLS